jgi:hypothetical protein
MLWEAWLIELKISLENNAQSSSVGDPRAALICDRGVFDSRAYLSSDADWDKLLRLASWTEEELLGRYSAVVCLDVAPSAHYNQGNLARTETFTEAVERGDATWQAWNDAADRVDARAGRTDKWGPSGRGRAPRGAPRPHVVSNPLVGGFDAKMAALEACLESELFWATFSRSQPVDGRVARGEGGGGGATGGARAAPLTMPVDFLVAQADAVASSESLFPIFDRSVQLLRAVQAARTSPAPNRHLSVSALRGMTFGGQLSS